MYTFLMRITKSKGITVRIWCLIVMNAVLRTLCKNAVHHDCVHSMSSALKPKQETANRLH